MSPEEAQVASLNAMLEVVYGRNQKQTTEYNEQLLDTPYDGADEEDEFVYGLNRKLDHNDR